MAPAGLYGGAGGRSAHERSTQLPARACQGAEVAVGPGCSQPPPPPRRWGFAEQLEEPHEFTPYHVVCPRAGCSAAVLLRVHPHPPPSTPAAWPARTEAHGDPAHSCSGWLGEENTTCSPALRTGWVLN